MSPNSVRSFIKLTLSNCAIATFSEKHKSRFREPYLLGTVFVFILHFKLNSVLLYFSAQIYFDNSVRCLYTFG